MLRWKIGLLLCLISSCYAVESYVEDSLEFIDMEPRLLDNVFNFTGTFENFVNSSLFTTGALIIGGIILFEIALYALDVYYNQTYLGGQQFSKKKDEFNDDLPYFYQEYPAYPDPFLGTYRSKSRPTDILAWISLLQDAWEFSDQTFRSLDCQKRAICELWALDSTRNHMGFIDSAFKIGEFMNLPYEMLDAIQELQDSLHGNELEESESCGDVYPECTVSVQSVLAKYKNI